MLILAMKIKEHHLLQSKVGGNGVDNTSIFLLSK